MKKIINIIKCMIKSHNTVDAGKCPFTGNGYILCTRCNRMMIDNEKK
jgi:hypothetical protein